MPRRKSEDETGNARGAVPLSLSPRANVIINGWLDRYGGSKAKFVERILEFFAAAPPSVQHALASKVPADLHVEFYRKASEYFASLASGVSEEVAKEHSPAWPEFKGEARAAEKPLGLALAPAQQGEGPQVQTQTAGDAGAGVAGKIEKEESLLDGGGRVAAKKSRQQRPKKPKGGK